MQKNLQEKRKTLAYIGLKCSLSPVSNSIPCVNAGPQYVQARVHIHTPKKKKKSTLMIVGVCIPETP